MRKYSSESGGGTGTWEQERLYTEDLAFSRSFHGWTRFCSQDGPVEHKPAWLGAGPGSDVRRLGSPKNPSLRRWNQRRSEKFPEELGGSLSSSAPPSGAWGALGRLAMCAFMASKPKHIFVFSVALWFATRFQHHSIGPCSSASQ